MNNDPPTKIFFYESHPLMILGIEALINREEGLQICGSSSNHQTLLEEISAVTPEALILDLSLYTAESLTLIRKIRETFPALKIVLLSIHPQEDYVGKAQQAGADAYVLKTDDPKYIVEAVRATLAGKNYVSPRIAGVEQKPSPIDSPINLLTSREFQILQRIGKGETNRRISEELTLSVATVEEDISAIQEKLGLSGFVELLQFAFHWVHHEGGFS